MALVLQFNIGAIGKLQYLSCGHAWRISHLCDNTVPLQYLCSISTLTTCVTTSGIPLRMHGPCIAFSLTAIWDSCCSFPFSILVIAHLMSTAVA